MNICIYSIDSINYGNKLQNYALQTVLESMGHSVKTVKHSKISVYAKVRTLIRNIIKNDSYTNFCAFSRRINWDYHCLVKNGKPTNIDKRYDYFVIGSDQVWNPTFPFSSAMDYLPFIDRRKCISYSASIGVSEIPERYNDMMRTGLEHIAKISVREDAGAAIVKKLTGKEAIVLVDPTLLLTRLQWQKVSRKPQRANNKPFILTYFLSPKDTKAQSALDKFGKGRQIYELLNPNDDVCRDAGPAEFVWLFEHADLILTDSYHACIFSFLFNKPFLVYDRNWNEGNMNARLYTLLSKFHLERKYVDSGMDNDAWEHNYEEGYGILKNERQKAIEFLQNALEG